MTSITRLRDRPERPRAAGAGRVEVDPAPLLGAWRNYDEQSTGISGVEISRRDGALVLSATSVTDEGPVGWGETTAAAFAAGVDDHEAVGFTAEYDLGYLRVLLAAYLNTRLLVVDAYSVFSDNSHRGAYFQRDHLYVPKAPTQ